MREYQVTTPEGTTVSMRANSITHLINEVSENRGITGEGVYTVRENGGPPVHITAFSYRAFRTIISEIKDATG